MKKFCDVLCHNYVDPASIYQIICQIRPDPDPSWIHQIHQISGWIWIRYTPNYRSPELPAATILTHLWHIAAVSLVCMIKDMATS